MTPRNRTPRAVRKHVTTACIPCRDGKVKCDGNTPTCKNCRIKGKDCSYRQTDDKRKVPVRIAVGFLAQRVDQLSRYIRDHGLQKPKMNDDGHAAVKNILDALEISCEDFWESDGHVGIISDQQIHSDIAFTNDNNVSLLGLPQSEDAGANGPARRDHGVSMDFVRDGEEAPRQVDENASVGVHLVEGNAPRQVIVEDNIPHSQAQDPMYPTSLEQDTSLKAPPYEPMAAPPELNDNDSDSDEEVTNQMSCRLGRLQLTHHGQLRYFGSTSNLTLLDALVGVITPSSSSFQRDAQEVLENADLNMHVDEELERHLIELYFAWQDPWLHVVDMDVFWKAQSRSLDERISTQYYSRALSNAMSALGAAHESKYHPDLVTFPRSLSEFFGDRAKLLLELEMENPTVATIQALVVLSSYEASCTRDTRCWLYSGMAMRLAFDLGLHLDMTPYVEKGIISPEEADLRRMIFWGVYLSEQFWGFYLGRSPQSPMSGVSAPKPGSSSPLPAIKWKVYPTMSMSSYAMVPFDLICSRWVSLYDIMLPLTDVLYGVSEVSNHSLQVLTASTVQNLRLWKKNLPPELHVEGRPISQPPIPHILSLHMQYYQFMIHCHRPYMSKYYIQPQPPQGPGPRHARKMCVESAISIVKLLTVHENLYTFRRANVQIVSFIFSAALILIFITVPSKRSPRNQDLVRHLNTCFRALEEMGSCLENARRTSTFLGTLQRQWETRRRNRMNTHTKQKPGHRQHPGSTKKTARDINGTGEVPDFGGNHTFSEHATGPNFASPSGDSGAASFSVADPLSPMGDYIDFSLCNILLSEGIPGSFV
ncbi:fungal-specific transcription factor domain-containing protein [Aspergillus pseudocaelatus]|uniref:Fungal-specific transcription factor domain-containing protein n=1 Tax=Aspergillus pseudocaelatus TaxID=1825620 RepID=A0ABQ6WV94_9EURO|nr:fungal-specific transcription factor domain-containing protein [Aspergillus pseudocaelatus]